MRVLCLCLGFLVLTGLRHLSRLPSAVLQSTGRKKTIDCNSSGDERVKRLRMNRTASWPPNLQFAFQKSPACGNPIYCAPPSPRPSPPGSQLGSTTTAAESAPFLWVVAPRFILLHTESPMAAWSLDPKRDCGTLSLSLSGSSQQSRRVSEMWWWWEVITLTPSGVCPWRNKHLTNMRARGGCPAAAIPGRAASVPVCKGGRINVQGILHFCNATVIGCEKKETQREAITYE